MLSHFGSDLKTAVKKYQAFTKDGLHQGRRPDLIGGGLVRSAGDWAELRKLKTD